MACGVNRWKIVYLAQYEPRHVLGVQDDGFHEVDRAKRRVQLVRPQIARDGFGVVFLVPMDLRMCNLKKQ